MPDKISNLQALAVEARSNATSGVDKWLAYLESVGRLYRHGYAEQLLIHAQKPTASYCLDLDGWKQARRIVRTNSKSIAVPHDVGGTVWVRFLFDVSDTTPMRSTRPHIEWKLDATARTEMFVHRNDYELKAHIMDLTLERVQEYAEMHEVEFAQISDGMMGEDVDGSFNATTIAEFAGVSAAYAVFSRIDADVSVFDMEDFYDLQYFSSPAVVDFYAAAMGYATGQILQSIEQDVTLAQNGRLAKLQIQRHNKADEALRPVAAPPAREDIPAGKENDEKEAIFHEPDLSPGGGLPVPGLDPDPGEPAPGQIRNAAPELSDGTPAGNLQPDADGGHADESLAGDRPGDTGAGGAERTTDATGPGAGGHVTGQGQRSTGLGRRDEQPEKSRRGTGAAGAGVQQLSLFGETTPVIDVEEDMVSSSISLPQAFPKAEPSVLAQYEIDDILRYDRFLEKTKGQIQAYFNSHPDLGEQAAFMEYAYRMLLAEVERDMLRPVRQKKPPKQPKPKKERGKGK